MFPRQERGLLDFAVALLCLWTAAYHTPVGAAFRTLAGSVLGTGSATRSLLAYYRGGVYQAAEPASSATLGHLLSAQNLPSLPEGLGEDDALGFGIWVAAMELPAAPRAEVWRTAQRFGASAEQTEDPTQAPLQLSHARLALGRVLGSTDASVLAMFCGLEVARYAQGRAFAEGSRDTLESMARALPAQASEPVRAAGRALMLGTAFALGWPLPPTAPITSPYGVRDHPLLGEEKLHTGIDLSVAEGTPVWAAGAGVVRRVSEDAVNGRLVVIDHGHGVSTAYLHHSKLMVSESQWVLRGAVVGLSGSSGLSTGPHLHYQLELAAVPVDPLLFRAGKAVLTVAPR